MMRQCDQGEIRSVGPVSNRHSSRSKGSDKVSIRGTLRDEQGSVLPKASLMARQVDTNTTRATVTGEAGEFYAYLPAGKYVLRAEHPGQLSRVEWN
jgi:hypothetical protein